MGSGTLRASSYATYNTSLGRTYDVDTHRISGQTYTAVNIDSALNPRNFTVRECANSEEHPNTIPVILALDVTGSMGAACSEVAATLGKIVLSLYEKFKDIEFCIMGIGDLAYDDSPIQMSQFESDVRIAEALDKLYIEHGGGGNSYESYTAAWYMGLYHTKLDCWEQGRKGIIITMGDENLNPYLSLSGLKMFTNYKGQYSTDIETKALYALAKEKFDIFHISVDDKETCYAYYKKDIENSFGQLLGSRSKVSTVNALSTTIEECIEEAINGVSESISESSIQTNENGEISW